MYLKCLTVQHILNYAARYHADTEIVSYRVDLTAMEFDTLVCQRYTYRDFYKRVCQLAQYIKYRQYRMKPRNKTMPFIVSVMSMSSSCVLEICYACMSLGFIFHPINPKVEKDSLKYILRYSDHSICFYEACFEPLIQECRSDFYASDEEWYIRYISS